MYEVYKNRLEEGIRLVKETELKGYFTATTNGFYLNTTRMLLEDKDHVSPTLYLQIPSKVPGGKECSVNVGQINGGSLASKCGERALEEMPAPLLAPLKAQGQGGVQYALQREDCEYVIGKWFVWDWQRSFPSSCHADTLSFLPAVCL